MSDARLRELLGTARRGPGCEAAFELMDRYVEVILRGEDVQEVFPEVVAHVGNCTACREDIEGLFRGPPAEVRSRRSLQPMPRQPTATHRGERKYSMSKPSVISLVPVAFLAVSFSASRLLAAETSGVMMKDGKMMVMQNGRATGPMEHEMMMGDGSKVMMDGEVKMKDGKEMHLKDGQMMMMDGHMMEGGKAVEMEKK